MTDNIKKQIDEMSYEAMLSLWRYSSPGYYMFLGETSDYFARVMQEKRDKELASNRVAISKQIGWKK